MAGTNTIWVQAGINLVGCKKCKTGALPIPVSLEQYAHVKVYGSDTRTGVCTSCGKMSVVDFRG